MHRAKHLDDRPFVCETCGAGFKWKVGLRSHAAVHADIKSYVCELCGYATAHKSQIKAHHRIHTGDLYRCPMEGCKYEAPKRQMLKNHMAVHSDDRPHQCNICGKAFGLRRGLKRHMMLHDPIASKVTCDVCNFTTSRNDKLREHQRKAHNMFGPPQRRHTVAQQKAMFSVGAGTAVVSDVASSAAVHIPATTVEPMIVPANVPLPITTHAPINMVQQTVTPINMAWQNTAHVVTTHSPLVSHTPVSHPPATLVSHMSHANLSTQQAVLPNGAGQPVPVVSPHSVQQNVFPQQLYGSMLHSLYYN